MKEILLEYKYPKDAIIKLEDINFNILVFAWYIGIKQKYYIMDLQEFDVRKIKDVWHLQKDVWQGVNYICQIQIAPKPFSSIIIHQLWF